MKVYVVGPVTGMPGLNAEAFEEAQRSIEEAGDRCIIPHDFVPADATHERAMRMSVGFIVRGAEAVAALPGWERSEGASLEVAVARACGIPVMTLDGAAPADVRDGRRTFVGDGERSLAAERRARLAYDAGWIEGATLALWQFTGETLSGEAVAEMEERAKRIAEEVVTEGDGDGDE